MLFIRPRAVVAGITAAMSLVLMAIYFIGRASKKTVGISFASRYTAGGGPLRVMLQFRYTAGGGLLRLLM